jgi:hypothetical protein
MGGNMREYAIYKGILYNTYKSTPNNNVILSSYDINDLLNGFKKVTTRFNRVFGDFSIEKAVPINEMAAIFRISLYAVFHGIECWLSIRADGKFYIRSEENFDRYNPERSKQALFLMNLGFVRQLDEIGKVVNPEECEEIYEIRKDLILPKGFIPGETKELSGGYTVTNYNLEKKPFVTSIKTIFKDGIKLADFAEEQVLHFG